MTHQTNVIVTYFDRATGEPIHLQVIVDEAVYTVTRRSRLDKRQRTTIWLRYAKRYGYGHRAVRNASPEGKHVAKLVKTYVDAWRAVH